MGSYFGYASKEQLMRDIASDYAKGVTLIDSSINGNELYHLIEVVDSEGISRPVICMYKLMSDGHGDWGYKPMDESCLPYFYNCPLRIINKADAHSGNNACDNSKLWRQQVREFHAAKKAKAQARKKVGIGTVVELSGIHYRLLESLGRKGWHVVDVATGKTYRMPSRHLSMASIISHHVDAA